MSETQTLETQGGGLRPSPDLAMGLALLFSIWVGGVLVYSGVTKLMDLRLFAEQIRGYRILGDPLAPLLAVFLPPLEILTGIGLWIPALRKGSRWISIGLFSVFLVALSLAWARGLDISCGCFGGAGQTHFPSAILFDLALLIPVALLGWLWKCQKNPAIG